MEKNCEEIFREIMEQLFCYQYMQIQPEKKVAYIAKVLKLNLE